MADDSNDNRACLCLVSSLIHVPVRPLLKSRSTLLIVLILI